MRNAFYILAGIALLVGTVAPVVHAAGTDEPCSTDPKDPWEDPKDPWEDPKDPWEDPKDPWPEDPKDPWEDPKDPWEDPKDPWEDPKDPWPPKDTCDSGTAVGGCPPPFDLEAVSPATESFDDNGDGCVCQKEVPGKGNTGVGLVAHDNKH
ncbi:hypothetical protein [Nannocystis radixulma]|uniref:Uncharacterized protein n=1 Tax=Nannocystis radixulma TaxID=2995305 RepID=A0ABT5AX35_9BACT|nr:hypothetical protein [Nannocystis radixulma]MDC0666403.1 hypothetical protein [Nannocystis radixulma]